jgi:hypothetical protein
MQSLINTGDTVSKTYGEGMSQLTIRTDLHHDGVSIQTYVGGQYNSILSRTFTHSEVGSARVFYAHIRDCAIAGKRTYAIEWEIAALIAASVAVDVEQVAESLNADADRWMDTETAVHNAVVAAKDEIMGAADPNWKATIRRQARTMARLAQANTSRAANLTPVQNAIVALAARDGGRIVRGGQIGQASSKQIIALEACGLVHIDYGHRGNRRLIVGARLTSKGFKHAGVELGSAA